MITKYDVGQTVLIKAKVRGISICDEDKRLTYYLKTNADRHYSSEDYIETVEENIVCGWIGENVGGGSSDR